MAANRIDLAELRPDRVCLIKPSSLGDIVHALPVLSALRAAWPQAHLAWVVNRGLRGLLDGHPDLDEIIPFDRSRVGLGPQGLAAFARFASDLRRRKFDLSIDLQGLLRTGIIAACTGAAVRVGLADAREGATRFYTHRVGDNDSKSKTHAVDKLMQVVHAFGISGSPSFVPVISDHDREWAKATLYSRNSPRLILNVGARWLTKRWPPSRFAEVAVRAVKECGVSLIAVGAPEDRPLVEELIAGLDGLPILDLSGRTTLPQLAAVMAASDCVLSNDTGPLHLAAATGTRVVGVYTCTSPLKTGPYGVHSVAVASQVWCAASCVKTCPRMECMTELTADRVWEAVRGQIQASLGRRDAG
ncbi:MAG: ADP-heptose:LPS heptosyltransferase [Planctomycetota bacterium]|nr:ADP-heptose:LPS heptosyltransferase [Planctomycetota bacterium]